jgi:Cytochrome c
LLSSGQPLQGQREQGVKIEGAAAACVNCHRRSGLGMNEGRITIPPITGKYLFHPGERPMPEEGMRAGSQPSLRRERYTDETLARAIREGIDADGRPLSFLMPRFELGDGDMAALVAYLKTLSGTRVPGVGLEFLEFATIFTPDADPATRQGTIDVLTHFFSNKNDFERLHDPPLIAQRRIHFRVTRKWRLHVWDLKGAPETWESQLQEWLRKEPVFAVISGAGGHNWAPIHRFCQSEALPCLFPNVELPVVAEKDFYSVYFSRGVLLEADLIAHKINEAAASAGRVVQVYRKGDIGEQALAQATKASSGGRSWTESVMAAQGRSGDVKAALAGIHAGERVVLWLRADDLRALPDIPPAGVEQIFVSGIMGGLERAPLPSAWRSIALMAYPFELPQRRAVLLNYPLGWFRIQQIPVVDEHAQVNTYIACQIMAEALGHAYGEFVRDYVLEQIENSVSFRLINGYYTRLGLAPGQRFASKGGYLVHFAESSGSRLTAEHDWLVP